MFKPSQLLIILASCLACSLSLAQGAPAGTEADPILPTSCTNVINTTYTCNPRGKGSRVIDIKTYNFDAPESQLFFDPEVDEGFSISVSTGSIIAVRSPSYMYGGSSAYNGIMVIVGDQQFQTTLNQPDAAIPLPAGTTQIKVFGLGVFSNPPPPMPLCLACVALPSTFALQMYFANSPASMHWGYTQIATVTAAVPEASTWLMLVMGLGGIVMATLFRRKTTAFAQRL